MPSKLKMTGIRLTEEQNYKIRYIAEKHHRKLNDEFKMIVDNHIKQYEMENGEIKIEEEGESGKTIIIGRDNNGTIHMQ